MPLVKISSWGNKGRSQERAHLKYIARHGTLCDETGASIDIDTVLDSGRYDPRRRTMSVHGIISLPKEGTEAARAIVMAELAERYPHFVAAVHMVNDNGESQPHVHFVAQSYRGWAWRQSKMEWKSLKGSLDQKFAAAGLGFKKQPGRIYRSRTQSEIHMKQRFQRTGSTQKIWKDTMAKAVQCGIKEASAIASGDIFAVISVLLKFGISVSRMTEKTITMQDAQGNKCRLNKLYPQLKTQADVERLIRDMRTRQTAQPQSVREDKHTATAQKPTTLPPPSADSLRQVVERQERLKQQMTQKQTQASLTPGI